MAFTKEELEQWQPIIASAIEKQRPPTEVRSQLDIGYTIEDQSIYHTSQVETAQRENENTGRKNYVGLKPTIMEGLLAKSKYELV